jgi:hypothetical protein
MAQRLWHAPYPCIKAVLTWDAFLDALVSDHPYPEYSQCILCGKNYSLVEVDCGPWAAGEHAGLAIPSTETWSWGLLCRDQMRYLVGVHCVCQPCLLEVVQSGELPWDPDDLRRHGLRGEEGSLLSCVPPVWPCPHRTQYAPGQKHSSDTRRSYAAPAGGRYGPGGPRQPGDCGVRE